MCKYVYIWKYLCIYYNKSKIEIISTFCEYTNVLHSKNTSVLTQWYVTHTLHMCNVVSRQ